MKSPREAIGVVFGRLHEIRHLWWAILGWMGRCRRAHLMAAGQDLW